MTVNFIANHETINIQKPSIHEKKEKVHQHKLMDFFGGEDATRTCLADGARQKNTQPVFKLCIRWRRGCDSNAQCLAAHHISNVAPYQLEYLSNWQFSRPFWPASLL